MDDNQKPPTQSVGVEGFKADLYATDAQGIVYDWVKLAHLPKFQMYALEVMGHNYGTHENVMQWIFNYIKDRVKSYGEQNLYDDYVRWHDYKGYWPNETPLGGIL